MKHLITPAVAALFLCAPAGAQQAPQSVAPEAMQHWAPALAGYTDRVLFGDVWRRPALSPRDRSLVTVSVLIATGKTSQLEGHLGRALDNGVSPSEIAGLVTHLAFYAGWPSAVSALEVVDKVMTARGIAPVSIHAAGPLLPASASDPAHSAMLVERLGATAPKFTQLSNDILFGDLWRRPDLMPRDRSLVTIAALAAIGDAGQLPHHLQRALANGLTRDQIAEAFTQLAFYAGWSKADAAITMLGRPGAGNATADGATIRPLAVVPAGQTPQSGPASHFTGKVRVTSPFETSGGLPMGGATVAFAPGARTYWHSHPLGQWLVVTAGEGRVQTRGGAVRVIRAGDVIWTAPGVEHWHGASANQAMTHVAMSETATTPVLWGAPVTTGEYDGTAQR